MFVDVENRTIHKGWDRTNVPRQMAHHEQQVVDELLEAQLEAKAEIAYNASIEFNALYDFAKLEEQRREV